MAAAAEKEKAAAELASPLKSAKAESTEGRASSITRLSSPRPTRLRIPQTMAMAAVAQDTAAAAVEGTARPRPLRTGRARTRPAGTGNCWTPGEEIRQFTELLFKTKTILSPQAEAKKQPEEEAEAAAQAAVQLAGR